MNRTQTVWRFLLLVVVLASFFACSTEAERAYKNAKRLAKMGSYDKAIAEYKRTLELDPNYSKVYARMGDAYEKQGNIEEAMKCFRTAIEKQPASLRGYTRLITLLRDTGKLEESRNACLSALKSPAAESEEDKEELEELLQDIEKLIKESKRASQ